MLVNGKPVCGPCSKNPQAMKGLKSCFKCKNPIDQEDAVIGNENLYHTKCFNCDRCGEKIGNSLAPIGDKIYHIGCYQALKGLVCCMCNCGIDGKYLQNGNLAIHPTCLEKVKSASDNQQID